MLWRKLQLDWRYAIGEFTIVLFGVLAALAVDNWNSERQNRALEFVYLDALLADLEKDLASIDHTMDGAQIFAERGRILLEAIATKNIPVSPRDFVDAATTAAYLRFATFTQATFNDLMATGNLRLIRDPELRGSISNYYNVAEARGQWNQNWREYQVHLGKIVPKFVPLRFRDAWEYQNAGGPPWAEKTLDPSSAEAQDILERLLALPEARPAIENMVRAQGVHYTYSGILREELLGLIEEVKEYRAK